VDHPVVTLVEDTDVVLIGERSENTDDTLVSYELSYGQAYSIQTELASITLARALDGRIEDLPRVPVGVDTAASFYAQASADLDPHSDIGIGRVEKDEAYWISDPATASKVVTNKLYWEGFAVRDFEVGPLTAVVLALEPGAVIRYTATSAGLTDALAYVSMVTESIDDITYQITLIQE